MTSTDDVLALIDAALDDWTVGPDAMRVGAPAGTGGTEPAGARQRMLAAEAAVAQAVLDECPLCAADDDFEREYPVEWRDPAPMSAENRPWETMRLIAASIGYAITPDFSAMYRVDDDARGGP